MARSDSATRTSFWKPAFDVYDAEIDGRRVIVVVDLAAADHMPVESHGLRLHVRVKMQNPREDGLRSAEESDALHGLEDHIVTSIESKSRGLYVGRHVVGGLTTFVFYLPSDGGGTASDVRALLGATSPYDPYCETFEDRSWDFYADYLYPDEYNYQTIANRKILQSLVQRGDPLLSPRYLEHTAFFPSEANATTAAEELEALGFSTDVPYESRSESGQRWCLMFQRPDQVGDGHADAVSFEVLDVVLPHEGEYAGWDAPAIIEE